MAGMPELQRSVSQELPHGALLKPFELGWKRELVYRSARVSENRPLESRAADVYYISPGGKKLRSFPEVGRFLAVAGITSLTAKNFTFRRAAISYFPFEIVREVTQVTPADSVKVSNSDDVTDITPRLTSNVAKRGRPRLFPVGPDRGKPARKKFIKNPEHRSVSESVPSLYLPYKKENIDFVDYRICGMFTFQCDLHCPGQEGIVPTISCSSCLRMFHPACVQLRKEVDTSFTCDDCFNMSEETSGAALMESKPGFEDDVFKIGHFKSRALVDNAFQTRLLESNERDSLLKNAGLAGQGANEEADKSGNEMTADARNLSEEGTPKSVDRALMPVLTPAPSFNRLRVLSSDQTVTQLPPPPPLMILPRLLPIYLTKTKGSCSETMLESSAV